MPPKKRGRETANEEEAPPEQPDEDRRGNMAQLARRRAAHFAHFAEDGDEAAGSNVHVGSNEANTLGPWSSAVELVNAREKAQADREEKIHGRVAAGPEEEAGEALWTPSRDLSLGPRTRMDTVASLFAKCLAVLTEYVDCIDSLAGVPDAIRVKLAAHVCARRKMAKEAAALFGKGQPADLVIADCSQLDPAAMSELISETVTCRLERWELGACGRGFGDAQAELFSSNEVPLASMSSLSLAGAYRLSDAGLEKVLSAVPQLSSLAVPQCSRLGGSVIERLPALVPLLRRLELQDCRGIAPEVLVAAIPHLSSLEALRLDGIHQVEDAVVVVAAKLPKLEELGISYTQVTDAGLVALSRWCQSLQILHMDECLKLTDGGLISLAQGCRGLRVLCARRCTKLSDESLAAVAELGCLRRLDVSGVPNCSRNTMQTFRTELRSLEEKSGQGGQCKRVHPDPCRR